MAVVWSKAAVSIVRNRNSETWHLDGESVRAQAATASLGPLVAFQFKTATPELKVLNDLPDCLGSDPVLASK